MLDHLMDSTAGLPKVGKRPDLFQVKRRNASHAPVLRSVRFTKKTAAGMTDWGQQREPDELAGHRLLHAAREGSALLETLAGPDEREAMDAFAALRVDVIIIENAFEVRDLEATPNDREPAAASRIYALIMAAICMRCGMLPAAVTSENGGEFDRHVLTKDGLELQRRSDGGGEIGPHSEHGWKGHGNSGGTSPAVDSLCLSGLRNPDDEATGFALLEEVLEFIPYRFQEVLEQPIFGLDPPDTSADKDTAWGHSILAWRRGRLEIAFRDDKLRIPDVENARESVACLREAISRASRFVTLTPGTMWLAFNPRTLHWRDPIRNRQRWLLRTFGFAASTPVLLPDASRPELVEY